MRRPGVLSAAESSQFISSGTLSPSHSVRLEGRGGCLEPGRAAGRCEGDEVVVDAGGRGGQAVDVGGLAGVRIGALDRVPDLGQELGIERGGPERVLQALRAFVERQPGRADSVLAAEIHEIFEGPRDLSLLVARNRRVPEADRVCGHQLGQLAPGELQAFAEPHDPPEVLLFGNFMSIPPVGFEFFLLIDNFP